MTTKEIAERLATQLRLDPDFLVNVNEIKRTLDDVVEDACEAANTAARLGLDVARAVRTRFGWQYSVSTP